MIPEADDVDRSGWKMNKLGENLQINQLHMQKTKGKIRKSPQGRKALKDGFWAHAAWRRADSPMAVHEYAR